MTNLIDITTYLATLLNINGIPDYCPNGLQVAGRTQVQKIVSGVTACQALLDAAVIAKADAVLVHHGYFWKGENPCLVGIKQRRLQTLLQNGLNLLAYHLPLDIHLEYGNNAQLGKLLNIQPLQQVTANGLNLLWLGELPHPQSGMDFAKHIQKKLDRTPLHIAQTDRPIKKIAWCTGAAQNFLENALEFEVDAYLTGEISEHTVHVARESGIHLFAAGHHATERYGVLALGEHLAERFGMVHQFIDIDNPI